MNCRLEITLSRLPRLVMMEKVVKALEGLKAMEELIDAGSVRISDRNAGTVRALHNALDERWRLILDAKQAAKDEIMREHGTSLGR